jgi:hypothetical protein
MNLYFLLKAVNIQTKRNIFLPFGSGLHANFMVHSLPIRSSDRLKKRLWRPIGLWGFEDPTLSTQSAHRWRQALSALCAGCALLPRLRPRSFFYNANGQWKKAQWKLIWFSKLLMAFASSSESRETHDQTTPTTKRGRMKTTNCLNMSKKGDSLKHDSQPWEAASLMYIVWTLFMVTTI